MALRIPVIGISVSPTATGTFTGAADLAGAIDWAAAASALGAAGSAFAVGIFPLSIIANKSLRVIRPSLPVPSTSVKSISFSCAIFNTAGE